nr:zinc finger, CCHC-type, retrotransposon Gag domain protein [Tanacetum cinerariifolium]
EFRTSSGPSNAGGHPPPVTIHTWLECFTKQKPHSFEKATASFFPRAEQERLKREYHSIRQTNTETSTEFMQRFLRLAGFLGAAAGIEEE